MKYFFFVSQVVVAWGTCIVYGIFLPFPFVIQEKNTGPEIHKFRSKEDFKNRIKENNNRCLALEQGSHNTHVKLKLIL